jgi:threonine aldolase
MGNQIAIRTLLTQPPHSILCDHRSHALTLEAGGIASLSQAMTQPIVPQNGVYLTLDDVQRGVILGDDIHDAPTRLIVLVRISLLAIS